MSSMNLEIEKRIEKAIEDLHSQSRTNIAKTARDFNVPYQRLKARWNGRNFYHDMPIGSLIQRKKRLYRAQILATAISILQQSNPSESPHIGEKWLKRWLERHPEYRTRRRKSLDIERLLAQDKNDQWIITRDPRRKIVAGNRTNREYVTVVEAVSTDGFSTPPLIILNARQLRNRWFEDLIDERIAVTDSGYINDLLAYQWIQLFEKSTRLRTKGIWRMLICDGFGSHLTYEFIKFCEDKKILLFFLPPHTSHLLRPLDVGVFNVYKHYHSEAIEAATLTGCMKFSKQDFLAAISEIRTKTFKLHTIRLGFKSSGIWPINPSIVCDKLVEYRPQTPSLPSSPISNSTNISTPKTISGIKRLETKLLDLNQEFSSQSQMIQKLSKGAQSTLYHLNEIHREIEQTQSASAARNARRNMAYSTIKSKGIISSLDVGKMKRNEEKLTDLEAIDKLRSKWKKVMVELRRECRRTGRRLNR
ncbi:hypothetical protein N7513_003398 [Penicillium frequentans]|uniref:DDE-1 domain-containing protein n=1 Tax=Penicillium frequentans TaxID=3151616 RepID=A0AAD6CXN8_9EURO|nr:hypothetical protein N7494_005094 [Penicillium glabrum]KAJ5557812.1 hypothetical protein N7513_003398 [Penicillium glabrum]